MYKHQLRNRSFAALLVLALAVNVAGCAPYRLAKTPIAKAYVALDDYKTAQEVGIGIGSDPQTPPVVKQAIKRADLIGNPAAHAVADLVKEYRAARDEVTAVDASGAAPTPAAIEKAQIALARLRNSIEKLRPVVTQIEAAVRGVQK